MKFRNSYILVLVLLLSSCGNSKDIEESVVIYDPVKRKQFVELLDEKEIAYRIQGDGLIIYSAMKSEAVKAAFEKVTGKAIPELQPPPQQFP